MSSAQGLQSEDAQQGVALAGVGVFMQQDHNDSRCIRARITCIHPFHFPTFWNVAVTDLSCRVFVKTVVPYGPAGLDGRVQVSLAFHCV